MRIEIQEVTFKVDELFESVWPCEEEQQKRINKDGIESCRCMRFFTRKKQAERLFAPPVEEILIPTFKIDENGCAISRLEEKHFKIEAPNLKIKCVKPNYKNVWSHVSECIKASMNDESLTSEQKENLYVYICYREDIPDCVGICAYPFPLYKTKE